MMRSTWALSWRRQVGRYRLSDPWRWVRNFQQGFLHSISGIFRGQKWDFNRLFNDCACVPVGQPMISVRQLIRIVKGDGKTRFSSLCLRDHLCRSWSVRIRETRTGCWVAKRQSFHSPRMFSWSHSSWTPVRIPPNLKRSPGIPSRLYHRAQGDVALIIVKTGFYPGGVGQYYSGRKQTCFSPASGGDGSYISGDRAMLHLIVIDGRACLGSGARRSAMQFAHLTTSRTHCILWV